MALLLAPAALATTRPCTSDRPCRWRSTGRIGTVPPAARPLATVVWAPAPVCGRCVACTSGAAWRADGRERMVASPVAQRTDGLARGGSSDCAVASARPCRPRRGGTRAGLGGIPLGAAAAWASPRSSRETSRDVGAFHGSFQRRGPLAGWSTLAPRMSAVNAPPVRESNLGTRALVCVAAWLVPGLAHLYLKRLDKGAVFLAALPIMFAIGLGLQGRLFPFQPSQPLVALAALADLGIGLPYFVAWRSVSGTATSCGHLRVRQHVSHCGRVAERARRARCLRRAAGRK